jgi:hypothetical protein
MSTPPLLAMMQHWSPEQKLAVYDFCRLISETLWQHYEDVLLEQMINADRDNGFENLNNASHRNLELPFEDDDLSF